MWLDRIFEKIMLLALVAGSSILNAQVDSTSIPLSKYGLPVIDRVSVYASLVTQNPDNELVDMRQLIPDARFIVTYATKDNFLKRKIYPTEDLFMRKPAALGLMKAADLLRKNGYGLILYDGYRPYAVTVMFYEEVGDTTFVADPRKGSKHNRGMAIDLSLYDLQTGKPLTMPSGYDEASERAYHNFQGGPAIALKNRAILRDAMVEAGFEIFRFEWWHYDFKGWESCPTYDLWHSEIRRARSLKK